MHQGNGEEAVPLTVGLHLCKWWQIKVVNDLWVNFLPEEKSTNNSNEAYSR
jgi:hypothetical protein